MYPLAKAFIFVNKPVIVIKYSDIEVIEFDRLDNAANSGTVFICYYMPLLSAYMLFVFIVALRNFDLKVKLKPAAVAVNEPKEYTFSSIDRTEHSVLVAYLTAKEIKVIVPEVSLTS